MKSENEILRHIGQSGRITVKRRPVIVFSVFVLVGAVAFVFGVNSSQELRAWQAYLVNFMFWTGLAFGTVLVSACLTMTSARWGRPIKRLAEAPGSFLPVAFLLFWVLYPGREKIFPWIHESLGHKAVWLNTGFLFARDGLCLFVLTAVSVLLIHHSVRGDVRAASAAEAFPSGNDGPERDDGHIQRVLSPVYAVLYALILTLLAWDLIMSLDPDWVSTLFGAYYFIGSFYTGLAAVMVLAALSVRKELFRKFIQPKQFHDLGKLLFGFCVVTGDFFYAQFLVIWYGNLPDETKFVIQRVHTAQWQPLAWFVLIVCFAVPFVMLLGRKVKMKPIPMMVVGIVILAGMWFERFLLVVPSLWKSGPFPLGLIELLITLGFFGIMGLCLLFFFARYPMLPISDPLFHESLKDVRDEEWATLFE